MPWIQGTLALVAKWSERNHDSASHQATWIDHWSLEALFPGSQGRSCGTSLDMIAIFWTNPQIQNAAGQVSLTTDIWSDQNRQPYLAITAHWIAKIEDTTALKPMVALIAFHRVRGRHDGKSLGKTIMELLDRAKITVNVRTPVNYVSSVSPNTFLGRAFHFWRCVK